MIGVASQAARSDNAHAAILLRAESLCYQQRRDCRVVESADHLREGIETLPLAAPSEQQGLVPRLELVVLSSEDRGKILSSAGERVTVGSLAQNDLYLSDQTVSRFHCELSVLPDGVRALDLGSLNGTWIRDIRLREAIVPNGSELRLGRVQVRVQVAEEKNRVAVSLSRRFGPIVGESEQMRKIFSVLGRVAPSQSTVLLQGETGSGKGAIAEAIHRASARANAPFSVVDCGALPSNLLESELFGHERGAFTGAHERRIGAFEEASGGTLFLDEIGELPLALQPKLLRVLENRTIKRLGANLARPVDVRIVAATNRDLREEVNHGRFREDLFFRLAVVPIRLPPLRDRPEDIVPLARALLSGFGQTDAQADAFLGAEMLEHLRTLRWAGNVRELRNYLERALLLRDEPSLAALAEGAPATTRGCGYAAAKEQTLARFERDYVAKLLADHGGKVAPAASSAGLTREHVYRLMRKHGISLRS